MPEDMGRGKNKTRSKARTTSARAAALIRGAFFGVILWSWAGTVWAATYYVAPTGSDSNPGTAALPWKTPHKPKTVLVAGDTVYFRQGDYVITNHISIGGNSGTSTAPITYTSYPGEKARIVYDRRSVPTDLTTVQIMWIVRDYLIFDGLGFYQTPESRSVFTSTGVFFGGVIIYGASNVIVRNCSVDNVAGSGIKAGGSTRNILVEGNTVTGTYAHGFYFGGADGVWRNNRIDGGRGSSNAQGIQIQWAGTTRNKVYGNVVINGQASGVVFSGLISDNEVFNNIFINCGYKAAGGYGVVLNYWHQDGAIGPGNKFYNNTILGKRPNSALIATKDGQNVDTFNNIFRPDASTPVGGAAGFLIRNNLFFNATNVPSGNLTGDPHLANPLGQDALAAKISAGSAAMDKAVAGAPMKDFFGTSRPQGAGSDLGAHEYVSGGSTANPPPNKPRGLRQ